MSQEDEARQARAAAARILGSARTAKKAASSRLNGLKNKKRLAADQPVIFGLKKA